MEYEHLKAAEQHELSARDMPEHSSMPADDEEALRSKAQPSQPPENEASYFANMAKSGQEQVALEKPGQEELDGDISPAGDMFSPVSVATATAELSGAASKNGVPLFNDPDFVAPEHRRSAGSFSAASAIEAENFSPTER